MEPDLSVLLPYRDGAPTLREAARSILDQEGVTLELVAIDDGSTDAGPEIVAALAAEDARVRPLRVEGLGIVGALRAAAQAARGRHLARMDADDVSAPGRLAAELSLLDSDPHLGAVGCRVELLADLEPGEGLRLYVEWMNSLTTKDEHARDLFVEAPLCHPSVVLRREAFEAVGGYRETAWAEDYDLWLRLAQAGWGLAKVPRTLLSWRHRASRLTLTDARYLPQRFREAKAWYLAPRLRALGRPLAIWGAGPTGRRLARELEKVGLRAARWVDIDPRKIGRTARGAPIVAPEALARDAQTVLVAVGSRGARALIRARLRALGHEEGVDFLCAA